MEPMLKVTDLSVSYGHVEALRGVSIQVEHALYFLIRIRCKIIN